MKITPAPLQAGQAPSELELNSAGFTPLALANALRIGSSRPVYVAGLLRREPRIAAWSTTTTPSRPAIEPWISELLPEPATPVTTHSTPSGTSTSTSWRLWVDAPRTSSDPVDSRTVSLSVRPVVEVATGGGVAPPQPVDAALEADRAAVGAGAGPEVDDVVGDRDRLGLVLDDQHGVALVAQLEQQVVHPLDVVGVQADRGLVEDVGDVGERRAEVADHLGPLRLSPGQRAGGPVQRRGSPGRSRRTSRAGAAARRRSGATPGSSRSRIHSARSLICIWHSSAMFLPLIFDDRASLLSRVPSQSGQVGERDRPLDEPAYVRLHRLDVLGEHRLLDLRDQALVGEVDALDLDLGRLGVEELLQLLLRELRDRLVHREAGAAEDPAVPAVHAVAGHGQRAVGERLASRRTARSGRSR